MDQMIELAGSTLEIRIWGEITDHQPVILLAHEGLGCIQMWRDFPAKLHAHTGLTCVAYSRAGYGNSSPLKSVPRPINYLEAEAKIIPALLDAIGANRAWIFGHSDGASIGLVAASLFPDRILGATLLAPHSFVEDICLAAIRDVGKIYQDQLRPRLVRYHQHVDDAFYGWHDTWLLPEFSELNLINHAENCQVPLWVIQGEDDEYASLDQVWRLTQANPKITGLALPQCRHSPQFDQPQQVLDIVAQGLAAVNLLNRSD